MVEGKEKREGDIEEREVLEIAKPQRNEGETERDRERDSDRQKERQIRSQEEWEG